MFTRKTAAIIIFILWISYAIAYFGYHLRNGTVGLIVSCVMITIILIIKPRNNGKS